MSQERVEQLLRRWRKVDGRKSEWLQHWEDLARVMLPRRIGFITQTTEGDRRTEDIYDGTAMRAARGLANATAQMLRPEGEQWIFLRAAEDALNGDDEVRMWLAQSEQRLLTAMFRPKARFRQAIGETDLDLVVFGTAAMFIGRSRSLDHLVYQSLHLKDVAVSYDDEGAPDGMFRVRWFTLRQAAERFGEDKLSENSRKKLQGEKKSAAAEDKVQFLHVVTKRPEGRADAVMAKNMPFADLWIEIDAKHIVSEGGFQEFPFAVARWDTSSGEDYGRSPGMCALPDASTSQVMGETILVAGQRVADPPLFAPNDGSFDAANTFPGGISYYDVETAVQVRGNPFFPLESGMNLPITRDMQRDVREQIEAAFFKNLFNLPIEGPQMTATEIIERKEEFIREIGPVFGRLETDYLAPIVERSFAIMLRSGSFDPIPEVLQGQDIRFEYESPVKKIRQRAEAVAAQRWAMEAITLSEVKPEILDRVDFDELVKFSAEAINLPERLLVPDEVVQQTRQQRAEAQQEELVRQRAAESVDSIATAAPAAKEIMGMMGQGEAA